MAFRTLRSENKIQLANQKYYLTFDIRNGILLFMEICLRFVPSKCIYLVEHSFERACDWGFTFFFLQKHAVFPYNLYII